MPSRFMTDPHEMRAMAGRFDVHAHTVADEARKMWASSQNIAGAGWSGTAQVTSYDTMGEIESGFRQHRQHAARRARRLDSRRQPLRGPRAGLPTAAQLKALLRNQ